MYINLNFKIINSNLKYMETKYGLNYETYDNLLPYNIQENFLKLMREISTGIIENEDPKIQISLVHELRRMRKFHPELFIATFSNILIYYINNLMQSGEMEVVYHSLILVSEIFSH